MSQPSSSKRSPPTQLILPHHYQSSSNAGQGQAHGRGHSNAGCYTSNDNLLVQDSTIMASNIGQAGQNPGNLGY